MNPKAEISMNNAVYKALYKFYKKKLEKYSYLKVVAESGYVLVHEIEIFLRGKQYRSRSIIESEFKVIRISSSINQKVMPLRYTGPEGLAPTLRSSTSYILPEVNLFEIENARIIGATDFVLQGKNLFFDESFSPKHHVSTLERFSIGKFSSSGKTCWLRKLEISRTIDEAINLTGGGSGNFAHCLNENIAKLVLIEESPGLKGIPILVDDCISKNLFDLINIIKSPDREIIHLHRFELIEIRKLHHFSNPSFAPLDVKAGTKTFGDFTTFSQKSTELIRKRLQQMQPSNKDAVSGKYFFTRSSDVIEGFQENSQRHLVNQFQVEEYLLAAGFEKIELEKVNVREMLALMRKASVLVSPIGAALANTLFANPGLSVVALAPYFKEADYTYHARMMAAFGHKYVVAVGEQTVKLEKSNPNLPFSVDIQHIKDALRII